MLQVPSLPVTVPRRGGIRAATKFITEQSATDANDGRCGDFSQTTGSEVHSSCQACDAFDSAVLNTTVAVMPLPLQPIGRLKCCMAGLADLSCAFSSA